MATAEVKEYLQIAMEMQNEFMARLVQRLGEELFPNDGPKILALHNIVKDGLIEVHKQAAAKVQGQVADVK
jgi:hypothetical protein